MTVSVFSWRLWALVAVLMAAAAVVAAGFTRQHVLDQVALDAAKEEAAAQRVARAAEQAIGLQFNKLAKDLAKENQDASNKQAQLLTDIRTGVRRLYIPVRAPGAPDSTAAAGDRDEARAELTAAASEFLVSLAGEGDRSIRALNACIAAYDGVRAQLLSK